MSIPQRKSDPLKDDVPLLIPLDPMPASGSFLDDDYDPAAAIALLMSFLEDTSGDPAREWAEFLEFARGIDENREPGQRLFDAYLCE